VVPRKRQAAHREEAEGGGAGAWDPIDTLAPMPSRSPAIASCWAVTPKRTAAVIKAISILRISDVPYSGPICPFQRISRLGPRIRSKAQGEAWEDQRKGPGHATARTSGTFAAGLGNGGMGTPGWLVR
jgi:hypothetical protein